MRTVALALGISLSLPLYSAQDFGPAQELTAATGPVRGAATGDFNGDGLLDVVQSNRVSLRLFLGGPLGQFLDATTIYDIGGMATIGQVEPADLDGDGDLDVLFHTSNPGRIWWADNQGAGTFTAEQLIPGTINSPSRLKTADLDGDGDLDVYTSTTSQDRVFWSANLGSAGFGPQQVLPDSGDVPTSVDAGDFDGDGDLDLVSTFLEGPILVRWENLGSGVFGPREQVAITLGAQSSIQGLDIDGDGNLDLLTTGGSPGDGTISWYLGEGTGEFGFRTTIDHSLSPILGPRVTDIDSDGRLDLVLSSSFLSPLSWFPNQSTGAFVGFGAPQTISDQSGNLAAFSFADADGNGTPDAIIASASFEKLVWHSNDGSGLFGPEMEITSTASDAVEALMVDFDGDGLRDVVSMSSNDRKLALYTSLGGSAFESQRVLATVSADQACMAIGDLDCDGDSDFVVGGESPNVLTWYPNLGNGEVGPAIPIPAAVPGATTVSVADLGDDGLLDLLVASAGSNTILWVPNTPGAGFGAPQVVSSTATNASSVQGADMDGDGDLDVLYTAQSNPSNEDIAWRENLGGGAFGSIIEVAMYSEPRDVVAADVNQDGQLDVIVGGLQTSWFRSTGNNSYSTGDLIGFGTARCIDANDIDGDGDPDVLIAKNSRLDWHRRTALGGWSLPRLIEGGLDDPRSAHLTDVDGDGDPDVLYAGGEAGTVQWYENLLDPGIGLPDCDPAAPNSTGLAATLTGIGSPWVPNNALVLCAEGLPSNQIGLFLASPDAGFVVGAGGSQGNLCLSGPIGRFREPGQIQSSGAEGSISLSIDLAQIPSPAGFVSVMTGEQWHFQVWYRDQNPGPVSNFTNGLVIEFQ